jgi:hypothetical protein
LVHGSANISSDKTVSSYSSENQVSKPFGHGLKAVKNAKEKSSKGIC